LKTGEFFDRTAFLSLPEARFTQSEADNRARIDALLNRSR